MELQGPNIQQQQHGGPTSRTTTRTRTTTTESPPGLPALPGPHSPRRHGTRPTLRDTGPRTAPGQLPEEPEPDHTETPPDTGLQDPHRHTETPPGTGLRDPHRHTETPPDTGLQDPHRHTELDPLLHPQDTGRTGRRDRRGRGAGTGIETGTGAGTGIETGTGAGTGMQMAPLFPSEEDPVEPAPLRQFTVPSSGFRQQREDGGLKLLRDGLGFITENRTDRPARDRDRYVVFNVVREAEGTGETGRMNRDRAEDCRPACPGGSGGSGEVVLCGSTRVDVPVLTRVDVDVPVLRTDQVFSLPVSELSVYRQTVEDVVLTNRYGDQICGQICTENSKQVPVPVPVPVQELLIRSDESGALMSERSGGLEEMDSSELISAGLQGDTVPDLDPDPDPVLDPDPVSNSPPAGETFSGPPAGETFSGPPAGETFSGPPAGETFSGPPAGETFSGPPAGETFSGTITINNQSILVTIEDGILTLAAPPEGYVHREDDLLSLKEHLGMKDHEDIVLLNYDSGTKSIGKISTLAVSGSGCGQQDESRPGPGFSRSGFCVSDSELALVDDCSLPELGPSLDCCPIVKQEAGSLCAVTEADLVSPCPRTTVVDCEHGDFQSAPLIKSKKETASSLDCPEPGCSCTFDTRQKLKVHLLNHAEDPRPYRCSVDGCGWAFATSYKLKRHLQSHDKQRPHACQYEGCGRRFTTVYNLKAHVKVHEQDNAFVCEICSERFRSATRLTNHQRVHFEPQRPHRCEFTGCEKTFITFSALFSHNRTHFRETGHFTCTYPGCDKTYDKACRLKIHLRSHTGERPFVCDSEGCGWSFTSMSKLLRHKRKHDDDRRFVCTEEGCGKSFTRAEHLKGHSITHLGTKPFQCHAEGCNAKFSARSSLYIHSKKHKQDASSLRTRCPVANCSKHFSSRSSLKSHMLKHHHLSADVLSQMETTPSLTPSSELISSTPTTVAGPGIAGGDQLTNLDLSSLFSAVPGGAAPTAGIGAGIPVAGSGCNGTFTMDLSLVSSGILTIDPSSVGAALGTGAGAALAKAVDPLILAAGADMGPHHGLEGTVGDVLPPQGTLNLDDVQTVTPEALGTLTALAMQGAGASVTPTLQHPLSSSSALSAEPTASLVVAPVAELLASPSKVVEVGGPGGAGPLLGCVEGGKVLTQFVFPGHSSSFSPQKDPELSAVSPSSFLESGGSARTDYRAIQLAKKRKQRGPSASSGTSGSSQRKPKGAKAASAPAPMAPSGVCYGEGAAAANGGLTLRDPVTGAQYVQIQLLQDDPASDGDLAFQLSSQPSSSHSQLTTDLPVNILQEPSVMTEDDNGSDNSQFTGSTINLQDLE